MDYFKVNERYWNQWSKEAGPWSRKYSKEKLEKAKRGQVEIPITTEKLIPKSWLPQDWKGLDVLGLAAGGGQQVPVLAAAGAKVTSFDFSEEQLKRDLEVCKEEGLQIKTERGDMEDLSAFADESFDFVINPVSACYTKNVRKVYEEVYRVLRPAGSFITAFNNPIVYSFDLKAYHKGELKLLHSIPYSDLQSLSEEEIQTKKYVEFGHSLSDLIGGQTDLGFKILGLYEDYWGKDFNEKVDSIMPPFIATKAVKCPDPV